MSESIKLLGDIHAELKAIRELLAAAPRSAAPARATSSSSNTDGVEPPQPTQLVDNPGDVQVHFGKNNGVALAELTERSLAFYASVKEPRLDSSGRAYPPRPQDTALENAARQLYHTNKGTLGKPGAPATARPAAAPASAPSRSAPPSRSAAPAQQNLEDEEVPF